MAKGERVRLQLARTQAVRERRHIECIYPALYRRIDKTWRLIERQADGAYLLYDGDECRQFWRDFDVLFDVVNGVLIDRGRVQMPAYADSLVPRRQRPRSPRAPSPRLIDQIRVVAPNLAPTAPGSTGTRPPPEKSTETPPKSQSEPKCLTDPKSSPDSP